MPRSPSIPAFPTSMAIPIHAVQSVPVAGTATVEERGAIFTRREVADFILDLVGYTTRHPLHKMRLLEPSFGEGSFLFPALERLLSSYRAGNSRKVVEDLKDAVRCVELDGESVARTRTRLKRFLIEHDLTADQAKALGDAWLIHDNFLLTDKLAGTFTHVVGNPPYIRQERVPEALMAEYRRRYHTIYDRADIYVPFIERSLSLLAERGVLGFICADRWMKNRYGGPLRELVATQYHLRAYVDMANADAFQSEVIAYPAIFSIAKEKGDATRIAHNPTIAPKELAALAKAMTSAKLDAPNVKEIGGVVHGREPWILESADQIALIRRLEGSFPTLEEAGCKVGIGVATGADKVFIRDQDELDIESDRKVPLIMARDLRSGKIQWGGKVVINPFHDGGGLVPLSAYPKLARYFKKHGEDIRKRHVSQKNPHGWYRTIDRIYPALTSTPKLLIPDIKNEANIVYDAGHYYPHHNLYYVTSEEWDLRALQAVLLSTLTRLCIATYTTKMRGGYLRFQAQYLRRIRLPRWQTVSTEVRKHLIAAAKARDIMLCDEAVALLYNLSSEEKQTIGVNGIK